MVTLYDITGDVVKAIEVYEDNFYCWLKQFGLYNPCSEKLEHVEIFNAGFNWIEFYVDGIFYTFKW